MTIRRQRCARKGLSLKIHLGKPMALWTFNIKFPYDTQFIFRSLMFTAGEDGNLKLLTRGPAPRHPAPIYGMSPYYPTGPSKSGGACSGLNPHIWSYYLSAMTSQGTRFGKLSSSLRLEHRALRLQERLLNGIPLKTTLRLGAVLAGTSLLKPAASTWWG
jgi:hypothetical protein